MTWEAPWSVLAVALVLGGAIASAIVMQQRRFHRPDYASVVGFVQQRSSGGEPIVNWPDLSPGPPNELEVALQLRGAFARHPVLRLGSPPLNEVYATRPTPTCRC